MKIKISRTAPPKNFM